MVARMSDTGLGMKSVALAVQPARPWSETSKGVSNTTCTGTKKAPCPRDLDATFNSGDLPEGVNTILVTGTDVIGTTGSGTAQLKLDTSGPAIALSGAPTVGRFTKNGQNLHIDATDGSTASPSTQRSGVKGIDVYTKPFSAPDSSFVKQPGPADQTCPNGNCSMSRDFTLNAASGKYVVRTIARDQVDNQSTRDLTIEVDGEPPVITLSGSL
jgi:hypothetical protein